MMRRLLIFLAALTIVVGGLLVADARRSAGVLALRRAQSTFHAPAPLGEADQAAIARLIVTVPASWKVAGFEAMRKWTYVKNGDRWQIGDFHGADCVPEEIENVAKAAFGAHGTVVGTAPADAERYGLTPEERLEIEWADATGSVRARVLFGGVAPGERGDECFASAGGSNDLLRIDQNPWNVVAGARASGLPPFVDLQVVPRSLRRGLPSAVAFSGPNAPTVRSMTRKEIPRPPDAREEDRGPRYEWYGVTAEGDRKLSTTASFEFVGFLARATVDGFGPKGTRVKNPLITIALDMGTGTPDRFELGRAAENGFHPLWYSGTDRIVWISAEKAKSFMPDGARLCDLSLDQRQPAPADPANVPAPALRR